MCDTCAGALDSNPGTQNLPLKTIGQGIHNAQVYGRPTVFVAATFNAAAQTYREDITMVEGISLQGRYGVTGAAGSLVWTRNAARSQLVNQFATGVKFNAGITRATRIDGLSIQAAGLAGARVAAVSITSASPLLQDFVVVPAVLASSRPVEAVGIDVSTPSGTRSNPRFEGTLNVRSTVTTGLGSSASEGLVAVNSTVDTQYVDFFAGQAPTVSRGAWLTDSNGSTFRSSNFTAALSAMCIGFLSQGNASGVLLESSAITGCPNPGPVGSPGSSAWGVVFDACPLLSGTTQPIVRASTATGGVSDGNGSVAVGAAALDGCAPLFTQSTFVGQGATTANFHRPENAVGIACSFRGMRTPAGADSVCSLLQNQVFAASGTNAPPTNGIGLSCDGTCANGTSACRGSCGEVQQNTITAASGNTMTHVSLRHSSPGLGRNNLGAATGGSGVACSSPGQVITGIDMVGSASGLVNNFIAGGSCQTVLGVNLTLVQRPDNSVPSPTFQFNTIVPNPSGASANGGISIGVRLSNGSGGALHAGTWRNNILVGGPASGPGAVVYAFAETGGNADPSELTNNLFFNVGQPSNPTLYLNEGSSVLTTAVAINGLSDCTSAGNLSSDPLLVGGGNLHLTATSPARGAGSSTMFVPLTDIDGDSRPNPQGGQPDIGADEVP